MVPIIQPTTPTFQMFSDLQKLIRQRSAPFYVGHIRAHTGLPGPLAQENELADLATRSVLISHLESSQVAAACEAHGLHHLNAQTLRQRFLITREQAREIVKNCKNCLMLLPEPHYGVNPRGLTPGQLWQMDITHVPSFGNLKFIHVTIDSFSEFICASVHSGEATNDVINHMLYTFTVLGQPKSIKTDNGPGYTSNKFKQFCLQLGIEHVTGIPYNPRGQGTVGRANQTLKNTSHKLRSQETLFPFKGNQKALLSHALFVLNFLTLDAFGRSAAERHWHPKTQQGFAQALWRDPITGKWEGPDPIIIWGKGSACIYDSRENGARWLPERLVKPYTNINDSGNNANKNNAK
ncbi:PREDICTED: endogenous retrovirus group K member 8 Pol protein-like [Dipodomys ordii]|uniref:RNA-directed DNA polymerase n=1 Tax=Dipodomys ordii TaxID=10020 RepID=A0A1S3FS20_DIPOR|nr:PREDICTED: endogenous retrovirus group K member 8 Pol protein-like [Dipodomys ordii]